MPEVKQRVTTFEVNYICDKCGHGVMEKSGDKDPASGEYPHVCVICNHSQGFKGLTYPRIVYEVDGESD